jgi:hypothetical protein
MPQVVGLSNFSYAPEDGRLFQKMDKGPPKVRNLTSASTRPVALMFQCPTDILAKFENFWLVTLKKGTMPFFFPDQVYSGTAFGVESGNSQLTGVLGIEPDSDEALSVEGWWLCMFGENAPQVTPVASGPFGKIWQVSFELNILPG